MALPPTTTTHSRFTVSSAFPRSLLAIGDQVASVLADFPSEEWSPLLCTLLSIQHDRLGGFSLKDVWTPDPPSRPPSHSEDFQVLQASLAELAAEVRVLKTLVSAPRAPPGAPP
jgi:hypothetical protein